MFSWMHDEVVTGPPFLPVPGVQSLRRPRRPRGKMRSARRVRSGGMSEMMDAAARRTCVRLPAPRHARPPTPSGMRVAPIN